MSADIERWGTGLERINKECKAANTRVEFEKLKSGFLVTFFRKDFQKDETTTQEPPKTIKSDGIKDGLSDGIKDGLNQVQLSILAEIKNNRGITNRELSEVVKITIRNIEKNIAKLKKYKLIKRVGSRKSGYWKVKSIS